MTNEIPYLKTSDISLYPQKQLLEQKAKFGEATFDEVVQLNIIREKIYQESALLAVTNDVVRRRAMDTLEAQIFAPGDDAVRVTYPVPPEAIGKTQRAEPVSYNIQKVDLDMAEVRYFISDDAKLRGASQWLQEDSVRRASEHMAEQIDKHVLTNLVTAAPSGNTNAATAVWTGNSATPEDDVATAISNIIKNSNIPTNQINKPQAFGLILPAAAFVGVTKLKLIRNITQPIQDFLGTEYKVRIFLTRQPRVESAWPVDTEALVVPLGDPSIGFLGTFDGGGIIPAQKRIEYDRGEEIITRQWFKWLTIPEPLDGTTTTNARIAKITGVAS